jgi:hypothetical protein
MDRCKDLSFQRQRLLRLSCGILSVLLSVPFLLLFLRLLLRFQENPSFSSALSVTILLSYESLALSLFFLVTGVLLVIFFRKEKIFFSLFPAFFFLLLSFLTTLSFLFAFLFFTGEEKDPGFLEGGRVVLLVSSFVLFALGEKEEEGRRRGYRLLSASLLSLSFLAGCFFPLLLSSFQEEEKICFLVFYLLLLVSSFGLILFLMLGKEEGLEEKTKE